MFGFDFRLALFWVCWTWFGVISPMAVSVFGALGFGWLRLIDCLFLLDLILIVGVVLYWVCVCGLVLYDCWVLFSLLVCLI